MNYISEVQITPVKPQDGLVAFASLVLSGNLYVSSIAVFTRPSGGYRLVYPTKKVGFRDMNLFHPISKELARQIDEEVITKYEEVMRQNNDRYNCSNS